MSLIEAPKLVSIKQERKKEKSCRRWTDHFSINCIYEVIITQDLRNCRESIDQVNFNGHSYDFDHEI